MHSAFGEQVFSGLPRAAEAFEQEDGFRKFALDARNNVLPRRDGNFIAGVAAETVHAAFAPDHQRFGDDVPKFDVVLFQFHQIFPDRAPSTGAGKFAVGFFQEKLRAVLLQRGAPAGVVDDDVNENAQAKRMRCESQLAKLIDAGGALVELGKRGINGGQIKRGVRASETSEAGVSRGRRMHRQQMQNAAAELVCNVRQLFCEVAEFSGGRNDGEIFFVERFELGFKNPVSG